MPKANDTQVGGDHYRRLGDIQHWDLAVLYGWDWCQYQITKYVMRWRSKNGLQDLLKVRHFIDKYIEEVQAGRISIDPAAEQLQPREAWLAKLGVDRYVRPEVHVLEVEDPRYVRVPVGKIKPTGWVGFTYEADKDNRELYTCIACRAKVAIAVGAAPCNEHQCDASQPGAGYVRQD